MPGKLTLSLPLLLLLLSLLLPFIPTASAAHKDHSNSNSFTFSGGGGEKSGECSFAGGSLKEGEERLFKKYEQNCTILYCTKEGMSSTEAECYAPRCLNPRLKKKGACCKSCPDGENCLLPNGTVLMATDVVQVGNAVCRCPKIQTGLGWNDDLRNAVCRVTTTPAPTTTTPVPSCRLPEEGGEKGKGGEEEEEEEGKEESRVVVLEPGKEKIVPKEENCRKYVCDARGQLTTYYGQCPELNCTDATREPGDCCKTCPDDADASSSPTSYVTKPPPRVNSFFFSILNFIRLLFFGNTSPSPSTSKTHHHHHHHRHHRRHHHGSKAKTGSDASTGSGNRKEVAQQPRRWSFFTFFHG